jgi:glutathione S-transferase
MDGLFQLVDAELKASGGPYFLGKEFTLVDVMFTPFLERMAASLPYFKGFEARSSKYPHLKLWYESMDSRPAYIGIKSDYYSHCHDLPPQIGACFFSPEAAPFKQEIDGGCWDVNKDPASCLEPMLPADSHEARRDAVRNLMDNHEAVVKFACRGAGSAGFPGVRAELADPRATPNLNMVPPTDYVLRTVVHNLISTEPMRLKKEGMPAPDKVAACLVYLRDRVGVPRDMTVHAARQFRAHLNQAIAQLQS